MQNEVMYEVANGNFITQYVRDDGRHKKGVMLATLYGNSIAIGVSRCHSNIDMFDKEKGIFIAKKRIDTLLKTRGIGFLNGTGDITTDSQGHKIISRNKTDFTELNQINAFVARARKFFKTDTVFIWV